ncbi:MAG: hypothetical protein ACK486_08250, partial [Cyanobacteriota bacterium]
MAAEPLGSERRRLWEERLIAAAGWPELQAIDPALVQAFVLPLLDRLERRRAPPRGPRGAACGGGGAPRPP